jgi:hypothetical protein
MVPRLPLLTRTVETQEAELLGVLTPSNTGLRVVETAPESDTAAGEPAGTGKHGWGALGLLSGKRQLHKGARSPSAPPSLAQGSLGKGVRDASSHPTLTRQASTLRVRSCRFMIG